MKALATVDLFEGHVQVRLLEPDNTEIQTSQFPYGGFCEEGAGLYLAQHHRDAQLVQPEEFNDAVWEEIIQAAEQKGQA